MYLVVKEEISYGTTENFAEIIPKIMFNVQIKYYLLLAT